MVNKCANPACATALRYLRGGKLFMVEMAADGTPNVSGPALSPKKPSVRLEHFWLCESCCGALEVIVMDGAVRVTSKPVRAKSAGAAA